MLVVLIVLLVLSGPIGLLVALLAFGRMRHLQDEVHELRRTLREANRVSHRDSEPRHDSGRDAVGPDAAGRDEPGSRAAPPPAPAADSVSSHVGDSVPEHEPDSDLAPWESTSTTGGREETETESATSAAPPPLPESKPQRVAGSGSGPGGRDLESWIGAEWLTWIGVIAILFGTAFFLAVSLDAHPLAGMGQVAIGAAVAVAFLAVGSWLLGKTGFFLAQGLLGGGTALLFLAIYAATEFHGILETPVAYAFLALTSIAGATLAVNKDSRTVATLTLIGALLTPLVMEPQPQHSLFFPYLFFVNLGTVVVRLRKDWPALVLGAYLASLFLVLVWWEGNFTVTSRWEALAGVGSLWLLYFTLPFFARTTRAIWRTAGTVLIFVNALAAALFLANWFSSNVDTAQMSAVLGLVYVLVARSVAPRWRPHLGILYEVAGIILLAISIPLFFDHTPVTVGWAVGAVAILWLGIATQSLGHRLVGYGLLLGAGLHHLSFDLQFELIESPSLRGQWIGGLAATAATLASAILLFRTPETNISRTEKELRTPILVAALAFFLEVLTMQTWRHLEPSGERRAQLGVSWVWGLYGATLIGAGFWTRFRAVRLCGVALLLGLVVKIFTLDLAVLDRGERIASFIGVGVLLLVISVLYQRKKDPGSR